MITRRRSLGRSGRRRQMGPHQIAKQPNY
jgi:hypothetical protein